MIRQYTAPDKDRARWGVLVSSLSPHHSLVFFYLPCLRTQYSRLYAVPRNVSISPPVGQTEPSGPEKIKRSFPGVDVIDMDSSFALEYETSLAGKEPITAWLEDIPL